MTRSSRDEFKRKVRGAVIDRAAGRCEQCHDAIKGRAFEIDHVLPVVLGGEPTAENAKLLCKPCHKAKSAAEIARVRKADRQRDKASGAIRPSASIPNRPFAPTPKTITREQSRRNRAELAKLASAFNPALAGRP